MVRMNAGITEILEELNKLTELTKKDVNDIMQRITEDEYMDPRYLPYYAEKTGLPEDQITPDIAKQYVGADAEERLRRTTLAIAAQTDDRLDNLSNTTAISEPYRAAIDRAVMVVTEGVTSYTEAMRDTVKEIGSAGMQVVYESGYHRRLDTAVRQNILDATGQIAQTSAIMVGEALKYNGMEISAHAMSAPDHEPVQGHVFLIDQFYNLQQNSPSVDIDGHTFEAIRRPISEWNCGHFAYPFDTRYSKRKYTDEELQKFIDDNKAGCTIGKKKYTLYEASQIMRRIECEIRKEKDAAVAAQAAGDERLRVDCQLRINHLSSMYKQVTDASGLTPRRERMTVEGFRRIKVVDKSEKSDIMSVEEWCDKYNPLKSDKAVPALRKESEQWIKSLSSEEKRSITKYSKNPGDEDEEKFYFRLNSMLSGKIPSDPTLKYYADTISGALNKYTLKHAIICYRSVDSSPLQGLSVGDVYSPEQYISTSVTSKGALDKKFKMVILAAPGSNGAYIEKLSEYPKQREFLFNNKCKYEIMELNDDSAVLGVII